MKHLKQIMVFCFLFATMVISSQELSRQVISANGGHSQSGSLDLSWTLGQAGLVGTFTNTDLTLSAGFQQLDVFSVGINEQAIFDNLRIYPNPCSDFFVFEITNETEAEIVLELFDISGKLYLCQEINQPQALIKETIDVSELAHGVYYLNVMVNDKNEIVKLIH